MLNIISIKLILSSFLFFAMTIFIFISQRQSIFKTKQNTRKLIIISCIISIIPTIWMFCSSKVKYWVDIYWTLTSRFSTRILISIVFVLIEHLLLHRFKISPRIYIAIYIIFLWFGSFSALHTKVKDITVNSNKVNTETKILFVSDIHSDLLLNSLNVTKIKNIAKKEDPDLILIWWDLLNKWNPLYSEIYRTRDELKMPIYAVAWNHDQFNDISPDEEKSFQSGKWIISAISQAAQNGNFKILKDESIIKWQIQVIWLKDKSSRQNGFYDITSEYINNIEINNQDYFNILLTHQPLSLSWELTNSNVDLELAWHTHNGQIIWLKRIVKAVNDYAYWLYTERNNNSEKYIYVSQWISTRWLPFRFGTHSEIVMLHINPAQ